MEVREFGFDYAPISATVSEVPKLSGPKSLIEEEEEEEEEEAADERKKKRDFQKLFCDCKETKWHKVQRGWDLGVLF